MWATLLSTKITRRMGKRVPAIDSIARWDRPLRKFMTRCSPIRRWRGLATLFHSLVSDAPDACFNCEAGQPFSTPRSLPHFTQPSHLIQPAGALLLIHLFDIANEGGPCWPDAAKLEDIPLQALEAMGAIPPPIHPCRHTHRHDYARDFPASSCCALAPAV